MRKTFKGYLNIDGIEYGFFIDDTRLHLIYLDKTTRHLQPYKQYEYNCLYGHLDSLHLVCLIGVKIVTGILGEVVGSVAAIIKGSRNAGEDISIEPFDSIRFMGETVNRFYNHHRIIDNKKTKTNYSDGSAIISIKPYSEAVTSHDIKIDNKAKMILSVGYYRQSSTNSEVIAKVSSGLNIQFEQELLCDKLREKYVHVLNFFRFINFRKNIGFDKIILQRKDEKGVYNVIAEFIILTEDPNTTVDIHNTISFENLNNSIVSIFVSVAQSDRYTLFLPLNDKEAKYVDYQSYINTSACFEYFYSKVYSEISEEQALVEECKVLTLKAIEGINHEKIDELVDFIKDYKVCQKSLRVKFKETLKDKKELLKKAFPKINLSSKEIKRYAYEFSEQRNKIAHGDTDELTKLKTNPFSITLCLLYIMILEESKVPELNIVEIIKKIFSNYIDI